VRTQVQFIKQNPDKQNKQKNDWNWDSTKTC